MFDNFLLLLLFYCSLVDSFIHHSFVGLFIRLFHHSFVVCWLIQFNSVLGFLHYWLKSLTVGNKHLASVPHSFICCLIIWFIFVRFVNLLIDWIFSASVQDAVLWLPWPPVTHHKDWCLRSRPEDQPYFWSTEYCLQQPHSGAGNQVPRDVTILIQLSQWKTNTICRTYCFLVALVIWLMNVTAQRKWGVVAQW